MIRGQIIAAIVAELKRQARENPSTDCLELHNDDEVWQGVDGFVDKGALADAVLAACADAAEAMADALPGDSSPSGAFHVATTLRAARKRP